MSTRLEAFTTDKYAIEDAGRTLDTISAEAALPSTLSQDKATLLQERKEQKQADLGLFNSSYSAIPKEGYVDVNRSPLKGTIVPGISTGYYPKKLVDQYQQPTQAPQEVPVEGMSVEEFKQNRAKEKYEDLGVGGRVVNAVKGAGYYFGSGLQDTADALVEGAGKVVAEGVKAVGFEDLGKKIDAWDPIGTEEDKSDRLKELTGFNSYGVDQAMAKAQEYVGESLKGVEATDPSTWGKATAGGLLKAFGEVAKQPELALGLLYIAGPNMVVGTGTKLAGVAAAKLAKDSQILDNVIKVVNTPVAQESMKVAALGGAINNNDLDSLQATLGKDAEGNPNQVTMERALLGWAMSSAAASLDKLAYDKIVGGIGTKPLKEVFEDIGESKARALVGTLVYGAGVAAKAGALEAPQEFIQSYVEAFNGAYGGKNKDGSTIGARQALNEGLGEAVVGGLAGLTSGAYASAGMQAGRAAVDGAISMIDKNAVYVSESIQGVTEATQNAPQSTNITPELLQRKQEYLNKYTALVDSVEELNESNAVVYVNKINELEALNEFLSDTPAANEAKATVNEIKSRVTAMLPNAEFKLGSVDEANDVIDFVLSHDDNYEGKEKLLLGSDSGNKEVKLLPEVRSNLQAFAERNGIDVAEVGSKISEYEKVGQDAASGGRGYLTYGRKLKGLLASDTPDIGAVEAVRSKLDNYYQSQAKAISSIENALQKLTTADSDFELEGYRKRDGSPFIVKVGSDAYKVSAETTLRKMLAEKVKNYNGIAKVINQYGNSEFVVEEKVVEEPQKTTTVRENLHKRATEYANGNKDRYNNYVQRAKKALDTFSSYEEFRGSTLGKTLLEGVDNQTISSLQKNFGSGIKELKAKTFRAVDPVVEETPTWVDEAIDNGLVDTAQKTRVDELLGKWAEAQKIDSGLVVTAEKENAVEELLQQVEAEGYTAKGRFNKDMVYSGTSSVVGAIEVNKATVLNTLPIEQATGVIGGIRDTAIASMKAVVAPYSSDKRATTMADAPARGLVYGKNGEINVAVVTAIQLAVQEAMYTTKDMLKARMKTTEELSVMLGIPEFEVTILMQLEFNNGMLYKTLADSVGKSAAKMLGISKSKGLDVDSDSYERLIADLGSTGILMAMEQGLLKTSTMKSGYYAMLMSSVTDYVDNEFTEDDTESTVRFIALGTKELVESSDAQFKKAVEVLPEAAKTFKGPKLRAPSKKYLESKEVSVRKGLIKSVKPPKEAQDAIKKLDSMKWIVDLDGVRYIQELLAADEVGFKELLGYVEISTPTVISPKYEKLLWEDKQVQEAKNDAVNRSIEVLKQLLVEHEDKPQLDVWFNWEYIRNGRLMLDSNTLNPQTDKQLHRFLVSPADHYTSYSVSKDEEGRFRFVAIADGSNGLGADKDVTGNMYYAIAQGLGFAVDKRYTKDAMEFAGGVLNMTAAEVVGMKAALLKGDKYRFTVNGKNFEAKVEHLGHMLQVIRMLEDYHEGKEIKTALSAEFDDVTSGFAIKSLQYPILEDMEEHFKRVGVRMDGTADSMNDVLASGDMLDSYQAIGANFLVVPETDMEYIKRSGWNNAFNGVARAVKATLPVAKEVDGKIVIGSDLRSIFKPVFMVFNYAAGMQGIRAAMTNDIKVRLLQKLVSMEGTEKGTPEANLLEAIRVQFKARTVSDVINRLRNEPATKITVNGVSLDKVITDVVQATYGSAVEKVLKRDFAPYFRLQDTMNRVFKGAFVAYETTMEKAKNELRELQGNITEADMEELVEEQANGIFPAIKGPLSESLLDGLVVAAETKVAGKSQVQTHINKGSVLDQSTVTVRPVIKKLTAAVKAGSAISIQQLDGAKLVKVINALTGRGRYEGKTVGVTYIHDAVIPPLWFADEVVRKSNEVTLQLGKDYSIINEVKTLSDTLAVVAARDIDVVTALDNVTMSKYPREATFAEGLKELVKDVTTLDYIVEQARASTLDEITAVGNSVGTSNMVYGAVVKDAVIPAVTKTVESGTIASLKELECKG